MEEHSASNEAPITSDRRQAIDTLLRRVAQHYEDEGRELSRRQQPFSLTTLELRVMELARCEFVVARDNIIVLGNSGTGKTHIAMALGLAACQRGRWGFA